MKPYNAFTKFIIEYDKSRVFFRFYTWMVYKIQNFILEINITFLRLAFGIDIIDHEIDFIDFFCSRHHRISNFTDICDFMNH